MKVLFALVKICCLEALESARFESLFRYRIRGEKLIVAYDNAQGRTMREIKLDLVSGGQVSFVLHRQLTNPDASCDPGEAVREFVYPIF
jgi:hypothetical protein